MSDLWAITAFFNPVRYSRKLENYRAFRRHLNVPLVAVELFYGDERELSEGDADIVVQIPGRDVLWQRERLLSIGLRSVPEHCDKVAWLDCDLLFDTGGWHESAARLLDDFPLVQVFREVADLPRDVAPRNPDRSRAGDPSFSFAHKFSIDENLFDEMRSGPEQEVRFGTGLGWAFRRSIIERRDFYSAGVLGGNDVAMACAAVGRFEVAIENWRMNPRQKAHYLDWAEPFHREISGEIGRVDARVLHLWHGELLHRRYRQRHWDFEQFGFDPSTDLAADENGAWCWSSEKEEMHRFVRRYFDRRREDG